MLSSKLLVCLGLLTMLVTADGYYSAPMSLRCSRLCPCYYQSLFCRGYKYESIPSDLTHNVQNIDFQDNELRELTNVTLSNFTSLKKLLLGNNEISYIAESAFKHQNLLNALDLSSNKLSEISGTVFDPIRKKLEHLTLQGNDISRVEGMFQKMRILKTLNLKYNKIKLLTAETLFQNKRIRYLQLANNNIEYVAPDAFKRQTDLRYLFLDYNNLHNTTTLKLTSKKLETLSISHCGMTVFPQGISRILRQLNFADNELKSLNGSALSTLRNLDSLDLSRNKLTSIDFRTFRHLTKLRILYLRGNRLQQVPRKLPEQLEQLTLDYNLISDLPKEAFARLTRLTSLALNDNMIEYVHKKAFAGLTELRSLDISSNVLTKLSPGLFEDLIALKDLDISNNPLVTVESGTMDGLWSLDSLTLKNIVNPIRIRGALLPDSPQLRILNLENSQYITKALLQYDLPMYHLRSIEYLDLMKNNLQSLTPTFPQYLPNILRIQLSNNPWTCTRDLYWLKVWLVNGMVEEPHLLYIFCDQPRHLRGRQLIDLDTYDWVSSDADL